MMMPGMSDGEIPEDGEMLEGMPEDGDMPEGAPPEGDTQEGESSGKSDRGSGGPGGGMAPGMSSGTQIGGASAGLGVHKCEGLFPADDKCGTNIKGLFAAGDCLSTMLAGAKYVGVMVQHWLHRLHKVHWQVKQLQNLLSQMMLSQ